VQLLAAIAPIIEIDQEQRACLQNFSKLDSIRSADAMRHALTVQDQLNRLNGKGMQHLRAWLKKQLQPYLAEGGRLLPDLLLDRGNVEFKQEVL